MDKQIFNPLVMAGGVGSRLWPLSRASYPKQFQPLVDSEGGWSMLQQTILRLSGLNLGHGQVICNQDHRFLAAEQVRAIAQQTSVFAGEAGSNARALDVVLEPIGRNTAPAVLVAALRLQSLGKDEPMLLLAADHAIANVDSFQTALEKAHDLASRGFIVTLGVPPTFACTGYGYIKQGVELSRGFSVAEFVEKPNISVANKYIANGNYLWNSGMFVARPSTLIEEAEKHCSQVLAHCKEIVLHSYVDLDFVRLDEKTFAQCPDISLDYAIMEHTSKAAVVPMHCGWSDVGDLAALKDANNKDDNGNVILGDVECVATTSCLIKSEDKLVATLGVHNLAVIQTKDAVLVASLNRSQEVKEVVKLLSNRGELDHHREVFRPWGSFDSVDSGNNYQVKRITVKPGAKLSLQKHQHRAEHWVVVEGEATVYLDGKERILEANDSIYIPKQAVHSLANNSDKLLHLIEVQSGSYLGEDDIERLEDLYGRQ